MAKTKIAYVIDIICSPTAGTEKQLLLLIKNLNRNRFEPILCCLKNSNWLKDEFNICDFHVIGIDSFKSPATYFRIFAFSRYLRKNNIDIVQTYFRDANIVGIIAARIAGISNVISTRRGLPYWKNSFELLFLKILDKFVKLFLTNSSNTKKWVSEFETIPEEKIYTIHNAIELDSFKRNSEETRKLYRKQLDIKDDNYVIGIVANLRPIKDITTFLRAAQLVKSELPHARFIIVGDGSEKNNLIKFSRELGISEDVRFIGNRRDITTILSLLDVAVLSSYFESCSNSIIEYLAAGLPIVCTDVGDCREAVEDGVNGFIVPIADYTVMANQIIKIFKGQLTKFNISKHSKKVMKKFLLPKIISEYELIYAGLTSADQERVLKGI